MSELKWGALRPSKVRARSGSNVAVECKGKYLVHPSSRNTVRTGIISHLTPVDMRDSHVLILMCSYNGERFVGEQIESFKLQSHTNWSLVVSDDGSQDGTLAALKSAMDKAYASRLNVIQGPAVGFARNFLSLTCREDLQASYFAWSDQDDIWVHNKLEAAVSWLKTVPQGVPALYCSRTQHIDELGESIGFSPRFNCVPCFKNALVQSVGGGNTMVFNSAARQLLVEAGPDVDVPFHDWWLYQLVSGAGGAVYYEPEVTVLYRQHMANQVGSNAGWRSRVRRLVGMYRGDFAQWNSKNIAAIERMSKVLTTENKEILKAFAEARTSRLSGRVTGIIKAGVFRQTVLGNISLALAVVANKI